MRKVMMTGALGLALLAPAAVRLSGAQAVPAERPKIEGAWTINRDMGDPMRGGSAGGDGDTGQQGHRHGGGGGGGYGGGGGRGGGMGGGGGYGGGGGRGGGMGGGGGQVDEQEMQRRRLLAREVLQPPTRLNISVDGDIVSFTDADGRVRKYKTDGKKEKHQFDNGTVETKTKWEPTDLVIETALDNGMKVSQTYAIAPDRRQLVVQTKMEGGHSQDGNERPPITHYYDDAVEAQVQ